jgi:hypothetical protein
MNFPETLPLWEGRFTRKQLLERQSAGPRAFSRGFQLDPYNPGERKLPHFPDVINAGTGLTVDQLLQRFPKAFIFMSLDPGGESRPGSCIQVLGAWGRHRFPLAVKYYQGNGKEVAQAVIEMYRRWRPMVVKVENVALQGTYIDLINVLTREPIPVSGWMTGRNKADPTIGIEGMDAEFSQGFWLIPAGEWQGHEIGCECDWCRWRNELLNYPNYETDDGVMALWFAWNAARGVSPGDGSEAAMSVGETESDKEMARAPSDDGSPPDDEDNADAESDMAMSKML